MESVSQSAIETQRRHELNRAYDAAVTLAEQLASAHASATALGSRVELAGLTDLATQAHQIRSAIYAEMLALGTGGPARPTPQIGLEVDRRNGRDRRARSRNDPDRRRGAVLSAR